MKARRLEEALDECLTAYLERGRTVEESLSIYPGFRAELEPLLRIAMDVADALNQSSPPGHVQERGRQEFLSSALVRRYARVLADGIGLPRPSVAASWGARRWSLLAAAVVAALVIVAVGSTAFFTSPGESPQQMQVLPDTQFGPAIGELRQAQQQLWARANQGANVSPAMIQELTQTTTELQSQVEDFSALDSRSRLELERTIADQYLLLYLIADTQPESVAPQAEEALGLTEEIAAEWGVDLPDLPSETTRPIASEETPTPTITGPTPSAGPTAESTPTSTPQPTSSTLPAP